MPTTTWDAFHSQIAVEVAGCPIPLLNNAIADAASVLLRRSRLWVVDLTAINSVATQGLYALSAPAASQVLLGVEGVRYDSARLDPLTVPAAESLSSAWQTETGEVQYFVSPNAYELRLVAVPETGVTGGIVVTTAVGVKVSATGLEQWIADEFFEDLVAGAKARLLGMRGVPWADPQYAMAHADTFAKGISRAIALKATGSGRAPLRTTSYPR